MPDEQVASYLAERGVRRLVHFSPTRNLHRIVQSGSLRSVTTLSELGLAFAPTDRARNDRHPEMTCCSIEYPNVYYLNKAKEKDPNFPGWAFFLLRPAVATRDGVLFSTRNASASEAAVGPGADALRELYADRIRGAWGKTYTRGSAHRVASPTDLQAEVLVPHDIPLGDLFTVALPSASHVAQERGHLARLGLDPDTVSWSVAPEMFDVMKVRDAVTLGAALRESPWEEQI